QPLSRLLYALGIRHVGEKAAFVLAQRFGAMDKVMSAKKEEFDAIREIGSVMAESMEDFFKQEGTEKLVAKLKKAGVNMSEPKGKAASARPLAGKTFVVAGFGRRGTSGGPRSITTRGGRDDRADRLLPHRRFKCCLAGLKFTQALLQSGHFLLDSA
ncbi:MAG: helix-hairpin-helix domain-containing protein, partial [Pseudomonadota bacterium]